MADDHLYKTCHTICKWYYKTFWKTHFTVCALAKLNCQNLLVVSQKAEDRFLSCYTHLMSTKCAFRKWTFDVCGCPNFDVMCSPVFVSLFLRHPVYVLFSMIFCYYLSILFYFCFVTLDTSRLSVIQHHHITINTSVIVSANWLLSL